MWGSSRIGISDRNDAARLGGVREEMMCDRVHVCVDGGTRNHLGLASQGRKRIRQSELIDWESDC